MEEAYKITIRDFEIQLEHCGLFEFRYRNYLCKQIEKYEKLLNDL